jgi:hypothetical protein
MITIYGGKGQNYQRAKGAITCKCLLESKVVENDIDREAALDCINLTADGLKYVMSLDGPKFLRWFADEYLMSSYKTALRSLFFTIVEKLEKQVDQKPTKEWPDSSSPILSEWASELKKEYKGFCPHVPFERLELLVELANEGGLSIDKDVKQLKALHVPIFPKLKYDDSGEATPLGYRNRLLWNKENMELLEEYFNNYAELVGQVIKIIEV